MNRPSKEPEPTSAPDGDLFVLAVESSRKEPDSSQRWACVRELHRRPKESVFRAARDLCLGESQAERRVGIDVLGQLGYPDYPFRNASVPILSERLQDTDPEIIASAVIAFMHLGVGDQLPVLAAFVDHPSEEVRWALANALGGEESDLAIQTLLVLSGDAEEDVRDYATFGLGTLVDLDQPEIREALLARVDDSHDDTRREALLGLARRGDSRVTEQLHKELRSDVVSSLAVEAAKEFADPRLLPVLQELSSWWDVDETLLAEAVKACEA